MTDATPDDYDSADGWSDDDETVEVCARCEMVLGNPVFKSPIYDQSGREFGNLYETEPGTGPFFCADCWHELDTNRRANEHQQLGEFQ